MNQQEQTLETQTLLDAEEPVKHRDDGVTYRVHVTWGDSGGWLGTEWGVVHRSHATRFETKRDANAAFRQFKRARQSEVPGCDVEHRIEVVRDGAT